MRRTTGEMVASIRDGRPDDASALEALHRRSADVWEEYRAQLAEHPDAIEPPHRAIAEGRVRVAVDATERLLGFSSVLPVEEGRCELDDLFVEPDRMRRGVGRMLVRDLVARAQAAGAGYVDVVTNPNALGFYRRLGFQVTGRASTRFGSAPDDPRPVTRPRAVMHRSLGGRQRHEAAADGASAEDENERGSEMEITKSAVFVQTNDAASNQVVVFARGEDGRLESVATYDTGGRGTGSPHLPSQGSVVAAGGRLFVTNAGSDDVSVFAIGRAGLELVGRAPAGTAPRSVAVRGDLVYVLGAGGITGFRLGADGGLRSIEGSARRLSSPDADGAQISFTPAGDTAVVTERGTDAISTYAVGTDGLLEGPSVAPSSGATPYGFDFTADGTLVVTEAFGGQVGAAAASSYRLNGSVASVSASVENTRSEVCWAAISRDGRFAYVTNFGDSTISSYAIGADGTIELRDPVAASTRRGEKGIRDEVVTGDGRYLYALDADAGTVHGWAIGADGTLTPAATAGGLPPTAAGLAAL